MTLGPEEAEGAVTITAVEQRAINVIRGIAMDAPQAARSGHPGTAMALAPLAVALWGRIMKYDPTRPDWPDRDRFILSAGHASILLYTMLHLTGYDLSLDDLRAFRQLGSRTPGHPEASANTPGVEVTTGPLGQGLANGVGMALAERHLRHRWGSHIFDHWTFVVCSDGDLQEGISHEAASLAGHLRLDRLVVIYDDNRISIDGPTELAFSDDTAKRFEAYGWHVEQVGDVGDDVDAIEAGIRRAMEAPRPSLVVLRTHIGWPSPTFTDTAAAHGSPLGEDEVRATKQIIGLPEEETFWVPEDVLAYFAEAARRASSGRPEWEKRLESALASDPALEAALAGRGIDGWEQKLPTFEPGGKIATRKASQQCLNSIADVVPGLVAGGADLTGNVGVLLEGHGVQSANDPGGRLIHYGVREHAMAAVMNGMALHGGVLPVGGTFFVFTDYMRPALRLAALSRAHVIHCWSHDSVGVGEDGPTHQPIEHLASLRAMPGFRIFRPADANETVQAWKLAIEHDGPVGLVLTRQDVPVLEGTRESDGVKRGAYVLYREKSSPPVVVLVGSGSELAVCAEAASSLEAKGVSVRVVSMPCWDLFETQDEGYKREVLPPGVPVVAVEAASSFGWCRWADAVVGIDRFGASAPGTEVMRNLGMTPERVEDVALDLLRRSA
ncbi:MAG: transketolase [Acidimicrobiales bacterium]|nr:MAG: transketolase [Acidimicrobiales bacterium]